MKVVRVRKFILSIFLIFLGLFFFFSLISFSVDDKSLISFSHSPHIHNLCGVVGSYLSSFLLLYFGYISYLFPLFFIFAGVLVLLGRKSYFSYHFFVGFLIFILSFASILELLFGRFNTNFLNGGVIGNLTVGFLQPFFNNFGTALILFALFISSLFLIFEYSYLLKFFKKIFKFLKRFKKKESGKGSLSNIEVKENYENIGEKFKDDGAGDNYLDLEKNQYPITGTEKSSVEIKNSGGKNEPQFKVEYTFPALDFLKPGDKNVLEDESYLEDKKITIIEKLREFKIYGTITGVSVGPVITTFEFKPAKGVRASKVISHADDLALGLKTSSLRIVPISRKGVLGIEVPNKNRQIIRLRDVLESSVFKNSRAPLTIALGKFKDGTPCVADLASMPHLLIAGSTGSGKSAGINSMIISILYRNTPDDVKFIMIDPKGVEFSKYMDIPHLLVPVVLEHEKAVSALSWARMEVKNRTNLLREEGVKNIYEYNMKIRKMGDLTDKKPLSYIVIVIDEFADLLMAQKTKDLKENVTSLAQLSRAVGIHIILATQRPSVEVVGGLIKANFPARISFKLVTKHDSQTIFDMAGAEALLGKGDMLYKRANSSILERVHGAFVETNEIDAVCDFWRKQRGPAYENIFEKVRSEEEKEKIKFGDSKGRDPLYEEIIKFVVSERRASTSLLQRRFNIGYGRAARIIDMLEEDGIVGEPITGKGREVLVTPDYLEGGDEELNNDDEERIEE